MLYSMVLIISVNIWLQLCLILTIKLDPKDIRSIRFEWDKNTSAVELRRTEGQYLELEYDIRRLDLEKSSLCTWSPACHFPRRILFPATSHYENWLSVSNTLLISRNSAESFWLWWFGGLWWFFCFPSSASKATNLLSAKADSRSTLRWSFGALKWQVYSIINV